MCLVIIVLSADLVLSSKYGSSFVYELLRHGECTVGDWLMVVEWSTSVWIMNG